MSNKKSKASKETDRNDAISQDYICTVCGKSFSNKSQQNRHERRIHGIRRQVKSKVAQKVNTKVKTKVRMSTDIFGWFVV